MKIIFDYNRTLFNPETNDLYPGVLDLLAGLSMRCELFLVSKLEPGRADRLEQLDIAKYFKQVLFVEKKTKQIFQELISGSELSLVVGDRVQGEISLGVELGCVTVWVQQGKFSEELPIEPQRPSHVIKDVRELCEVVLRYEK